MASFITTELQREEREGPSEGKRGRGGQKAGFYLLMLSTMCSYGAVNAESCHLDAIEDDASPSTLNPKLQI